MAGQNDDDDTDYTLGSQRVAMRQGGVLTYLHGDHLGSASLATNASGAKVSEQRYLPYGGTRSGSMPTDQQFTGQRWEASLGFYDYNARQYDSALGRFLQPDTIVPNPANPQSLNRYSYTLGNPLRYTDPSGHREVPYGEGENIDEWTIGSQYTGEWCQWCPKSPADPVKLPLSGIGVYVQGGAGFDFCVGAKAADQVFAILNWESWELSAGNSYGVLADIGTPELFNADASGGLLLLNGWSSNANLLGDSYSLGASAGVDVGFQAGVEGGISYPVAMESGTNKFVLAIDPKYDRTPVIVNLGIGVGADAMPNGGDVSVTSGYMITRKVLTVSLGELIRSLLLPPL